MQQLSAGQLNLVRSVVQRLRAVHGIRAIVLGGSHARGRARTGSDIDLGLLYSEADPFSIQDLRALAGKLNDAPGPVVSDFYEWGSWVNGGAWLTIGGQRVDWLYRRVEHLERVIAEAQCGRYVQDHAQHPPFGFFSATYLGEIAICVPLFDPDALLAGLKRKVAEYPEALRRAIVQDQLWAAEFGLAGFARKFAARGDVYGTAACLTRAVSCLVLVLFALNRRYPIDDKTALEEIAELECSPREFGPRVQGVLTRLGDSAAELGAALEAVGALVQETIERTDGLYRSRYALPV